MGYSSHFSLLPLEGGEISHRFSCFSPEGGDLLSKVLAEVVEDFLARLFYIVDERDIFGRYDVAERKGAAP